mmetsp:Transcript_10824/g.26918  ORF Transcript_10824/g.26918 Transcript_10824/m.26918 type:complete len:82 (+) Transcript_10824:366-611(+)|eukprot:7389677-Prymnesium_polylepis.4
MVLADERTGVSPALLRLSAPDHHLRAIPCEHPAPPSLQDCGGLDSPPTLRELAPRHLDADGTRGGQSALPQHGANLRNVQL